MIRLRISFEEVPLDSWMRVREWQLSDNGNFLSNLSYLNGWIFENANQISVWYKISNQVDWSNNYVVGN